MGCTALADSEPPHRDISKAARAQPISTLQPTQATSNDTDVRRYVSRERGQQLYIHHITVPCRSLQSGNCFGRERSWKGPALGGLNPPESGKTPCVSRKRYEST